jgi:hypothetical protein
VQVERLKAKGREHTGAHHVGDEHGGGRGETEMS